MKNKYVVYSKLMKPFKKKHTNTAAAFLGWITCLDF